MARCHFCFSHISVTFVPMTKSFFEKWCGRCSLSEIWWLLSRNVVRNLQTGLHWRAASENCPSVMNSHPESSDCCELILSKWGSLEITHSPSAWQGKPGAVIAAPITAWRGKVSSSDHWEPRTGQSHWPELCWPTDQFWIPAQKQPGRGRCFLGFPYSPASPSWLSHFPTSSSPSILCFWYHKILLKERGHYQTVKHSVRTFLSSKVKFPLSTVQILQSVLSAPGPKYCGVCGAGECQTSHCHQQLLETFCIHSNGCEIWLNPHRKIKNDWKKILKPQTKPKWTKLNPERWKQILTPGFITRLLCTLWKGRSQQQDTQWTLPFTTDMGGFFPILYFYHFCNVHLHSKGPLFPDGILPASLWLPSGRIVLHLPPKLEPALLQLSVSNVREGGSSCSLSWGSVLWSPSFQKD